MLEGKRSVELDPLSIVMNADLGVTFFYAHRYEESATQLRKTLEIDPTSSTRTIISGMLFKQRATSRARLPNTKRQSN